MRSNGRVPAQTKGVLQTIILGPKPTLSDSGRRKALRFSALRLLCSRLPNHEWFYRVMRGAKTLLS
jgi:hypothetical protein